MFRTQLERQAIVEFVEGFGAGDDQTKTALAGSIIGSFVPIWGEVRDITLSIDFIPPVRLPLCKSVEMESGANPCCMAGTAHWNARLPAPSRA